MKTVYDGVSIPQTIWEHSAKPDTPRNLLASDLFIISWIGCDKAVGRVSVPTSLR